MGPGFHGLLVIDKPGGITLREVVNAPSVVPRRTRIGHTGTSIRWATWRPRPLRRPGDPLDRIRPRMSKVYAAAVMLGARSDSDDADGTLTPMPNAKIPLQEEVRELPLGEFVGTIAQVPPSFSAAHVTGRLAYDLARKGKAVTLSARSVTIHRVDLVRYEYPFLEIVVACSKGTYIRSLVGDLGQRLGCGGYIAALRRLEVGSFTVADAL